MPSSHRPEHFFAHVLDGKAKNDKNVIPMEHGKHEKKLYFIGNMCKSRFLQHLSSENVIFFKQT